ncbi:MAG TPA: TIM44-like domain-containing protein, partial [Polyangiales bacterium]
RARGDRPALEALAPYLHEDVLAALLREPGVRVEHALVGVLRIEQIVMPPPGAPEDSRQVRVQLCYEANIRQRQGERMRALYLRERWTLSRGADVRTKPPGSYERLGCPNCAAPFESTDHRRCAFCHQVVGDGRFNWQLLNRVVLAEEAALGGLGQQVEERGTDKPPVLAADLAQRWRALTARDPAVNDASIEARLRMIYRELNRAWSEQALDTVRGLVSDGLYDYLRYWVDAYRGAGLRNVLQNMEIELCQRVKVVEDRYFDAVTLRVHASGLDYTVRAASGETVSGSSSRPRRYSEYWTLIRGSGVRRPPGDDATCPNCAAPLKVTMTGSCEYCAAHITRGEFDWVLSKIEQDDVYDG